MKQSDKALNQCGVTYVRDALPEYNIKVERPGWYFFVIHDQTALSLLKGPFLTELDARQEFMVWVFDHVNTVQLEGIDEQFMSYILACFVKEKRLLPTPPISISRVADTIYFNGADNQLAIKFTITPIKKEKVIYPQNAI